MSHQDLRATLSPREAVADALQRCVLGLDKNDESLFETAFNRDETTIMIAGTTTLEGWSAIKTFLSTAFRLVTTHFVTNPRVEIKDNGKTASMTSHAIAYHMRPEEAFKTEDTSYKAGCLWYFDLIEDEIDGLWKIKKWQIDILWTQGDRGIVTE